LSGRGLLKSGMFADITIFDPEAIKDTATFDSPFQRPLGILYVLVNGTPAVWDGQLTASRSGGMLSR